MKTQNALAFSRQWANDKFNLADSSKVANFVKEKLRKDAPSCTPMNEITDLVQQNYRAKQLAIELLGCREHCPLCGAKCQQIHSLADSSASGKHHTGYHFLQAFNGLQMNNNLKNNAKLLPCIDVCNSKANVQCDWLYNTRWSKVVRKFKDEWVKYKWSEVSDYFKQEFDWKIESESGLDENFVSTMLFTYFNNKLQQALLKRPNLQDCIAADKREDVLCGNQVGEIYGAGKITNKIVTKWEK